MYKSEPLLISVITSNCEERRRVGVNCYRSKRERSLEF